MKELNGERAIRCAHCGATRLLPLTVQYPRGEYRRMRRMTRPVRAELKCIACGHRHVVPPSVLLAS